MTSRTWTPRKTRYLLGSILGALAGLLILAGADARAAFSGTNGKVAYDVVSLTDGFGDIYTVQPNGSATTNLSTGAGSTPFERQPAFSPDATKIAYQSIVPGTAPRIAVMDEDGTGRQMLTAPAVGTVDSEPAYSADGRIVFARQDDLGNQDIWIMNENGTSPLNLTTDTTDVALDPTVNPTGTKIAYSQGNAIYEMNLDGTGKTAVTGAVGDQPNYSPAGTRIAFRQVLNGPGGQNAEVVAVDTDGTDFAYLTDDAPGDIKQDQHPAYSPDGTKIGYRTNRGGGDVYTMAPDGSAQAPLTAVNSSFLGNPTWGVFNPGSVDPDPQCSDGVDNDFDELTDFPADPGCSSAADDNETNPPDPPVDPGDAACDRAKAALKKATQKNKAAKTQLKKAKKSGNAKKLGKAQKAAKKAKNKLKKAKATKKKKC